MYRHCNIDFPCEESQTSLEERLFVSLCSESAIPVYTELYNSCYTARSWAPLLTLKLLDDFASWVAGNIKSSGVYFPFPNSRPRLHWCWHQLCSTLLRVSTTHLTGHSTALCRVHLEKNRHL